uniref:Uncharacterized protein n=1 Tax=Oryza rufipogon TaxID=4529 RepID=A0A0E0MVN6_ORYRU
MAVLPSSIAADCTMARSLSKRWRQAGSKQDGRTPAARRASDCFLLGWEPPFGCLGVVASIGAAGTNVYGVLHLRAS